MNGCKLKTFPKSINWERGKRNKLHKAVNSKKWKKFHNIWYDQGFYTFKFPRLRIEWSLSRFPLSFVSFFLECERSERGSGIPLSRCHRFVIICHDNSAISIVISIVVEGKGKSVLFRARWKLNGVSWREMITTLFNLPKVIISIQTRKAKGTLSINVTIYTCNFTF